MKRIPLTQGQTAVVCDCHAHLVENVKWCAEWSETTKTYYAVRNGRIVKGKRSKKIRMANVINDTPQGFIADHVNGNTLDNQCCNLRTATPAQNSLNIRSHKNSSSEFKGVSLHKAYAKGEGYKYWFAAININKKRHFIGYYRTPEEAARAYDNAAIKHHGEFARLNFPQG